MGSLKLVAFVSKSVFEHLQKKTILFQIYSFSFSKNELLNFKFEVLKSDSLFKTSNLKFYLFICILVLTIIHHIYNF
ncbi:unnamed protein product [Brassica napus]|uniref:(rape) hypothetical protein n=1 Tax=Brassica napus TaxID=3708 RepID=A0A816IIM4_BRANA|nr:unnamed protein product [Brassica napus]